MKLVYGVGINDATYPIKIKDLASGKRIVCPYYTVWSNMLGRCYVENSRFKAYSTKYVCNEWLTFSNFKSWMEKQDWEGNVLDKDLLFDGNDVYSEKTCLFIPVAVNNFLVSRASVRGNHLMGVRISYDRFKSYSRENGKQVHLGCYSSEIDAHIAYLKHKLILTKDLMTKYSSPKLQEGLSRVRDKLIKHITMKLPLEYF